MLNVDGSLLWSVDIYLVPLEAIGSHYIILCAYPDKYISKDRHVLMQKVWINGIDGMHMHQSLGLGVAIPRFWSGVSMQYYIL